jgi:hypothetical protein
MTVPIRIWIPGIVEIETEISTDTANKIACGIAGVAAGMAVMAAGAAVRSSDTVKLGGTIAVGSILGVAAAIGLDQDPPLAAVTTGP